MEEQQEMISCLEQMLLGSVPDFDRFYERYAPFVLKIAWKIVQDKMAAEDICHDLFVDILHKRRVYDPLRGSLEAWLAVMTRSRCLDWLRKHRRVIPSAMDDSDSNIIPDRATVVAMKSGGQHETVERVITKLQQEAVYESLQRLPIMQQRAISSTYLENSTQRELSERWQVPLGTVKSWIRYGVSHVRKEMVDKGWLKEEEGQ